MNIPSTVVGPVIRPVTRAAVGLRGATLAGVAFLFFVPFLIPLRRAPIPTLDGEMIAAALLALCAVASGLVARGGVRLSWPLPSFLLLLILVASIHWIVGDLAYTYSVTTLFMAVTLLFLAYAVGRWLRQTETSAVALRWISIGLVAGALISVVIEVMQLLDVRGLSPWLYFQMKRTFPLQPVANIGQPNQLAAYLALAIPAAVYLAGEGHRRARWLVLAVAVIAAGIAFSLSRMGVLMIVMLSAWVMLKRDGENRSRRGFAVAIWAGFVAGAFVGPYLVAEQGDGASAIGRFLSAAYSDRTVMWRDAVHVALTHPWLGVGVGEYAAAQYWVTAAGPGTLSTPYPHNVLLHIGAEFGIPAALALGTLLSWGFLAEARKRWTDPVVSTVLIMGVLLLLHGMLDWSLWVLFVSIPATLLFALGEPDTRVHVTADPKASLVPMGLAALLYLPLFFIDFDDISRLASRLYAEQRELKGGASLGSVLGISQVGTSTYFKPHADRMLLAVTPIKRPVDEEQLARTARVLSRLADEQTIALHIGALALADRMEEALRHVERLRAFAVTQERYAVAEKQILRMVASEGERAEPLRARLAALR